MNSEQRLGDREAGGDSLASLTVVRKKYLSFTQLDSDSEQGSCTVHTKEGGQVTGWLTD